MELLPSREQLKYILRRRSFMHVLDPNWDARCPYCGSRDIAVQSVTRFNEHWECINGHHFFVPREISERQSKKHGVRCAVDEFVKMLCGW
jgi:hypothetical protein